MDLSGKVVLVTGASRGIGRAIARGLAESGAAVAAHYHRKGADLKELGTDACGFQADLARIAECERLFEAVLSHFGKVDVLVNNAGIALLMPLEQAISDWNGRWQRTMHVNLRAAELLCRLAIKHFKRRGGGRIINVASRAAFRGDTADYMTYAASKGGMVALSRSIARAFGKENICSFVIAPGFVRTDMAQEAIDAYGEDFVVSDLALNRLTEPADIAPLIVLLASGLADHATGATIDVNAGSYVH